MERSALEALILTIGAGCLAPGVPASICGHTSPEKRRTTHTLGSNKCKKAHLPLNRGFIRDWHRIVPTKSTAVSACPSVQRKSCGRHLPHLAHDRPLGVEVHKPLVFRVISRRAELKQLKRKCVLDIDTARLKGARGSSLSSQASMVLCVTTLNTSTRDKSNQQNHSPGFIPRYE